MKLGTDATMSENWIQVSERIIEQLKDLDETKDKDRLDFVRSLRYLVSVLQRSLFGWTQWVNNPDIISIFTKEDLEQMTKKLTDFTRSFVKYDLEMTNLGINKGLKAPKVVKKKKEDRNDRFYV